MAVKDIERILAGEDVEPVSRVEAYLKQLLETGGGSASGTSLPKVTTSDDGSVLTVVDGEWDKAEPAIAHGAPQYYGVCTTVSASPRKVVECDDFVLEKGAVINVVFTYQHTGQSACALNVNNTGDVQAKRTNGNSGLALAWGPGEVVPFIYDGSNWIMIGGAPADTETAGRVQLSASTSSNSPTMAATASAVKAAYDHGGVQSVNGMTGAVTLDIPNIPAVTAADNGKVLMVVNGEWAVVSME